jgi:hypothetical protein
MTKASLLYRIASVLLLLFAVGHTLGFRQSDPAWGVDALLGSMRSIRFDVQGFSRSYWDLFVAAGFSLGIFYLFAAVLAWELGGFPAERLIPMRVTAWAFALCFAAITVVSWQYLFVLPIVFSFVITLCLAAAALAFGEARLNRLLRACSSPLVRFVQFRSALQLFETLKNILCFDRLRRKRQDIVRSASLHCRWRIWVHNEPLQRRHRRTRHLLQPGH